MNARRYFSRLLLPRPLADLFPHLAITKGFHSSEAHHFLYELLSKQYPQEVAEWERSVGRKPGWLGKYDPDKNNL